MLESTNVSQIYAQKLESDPLFKNQIWRVKDVADYLRCSVKHIYNLTYRGEIPFYKKGKFLFFIPEEIQFWIIKEN
ncbi:MAG: helix-turn-helix domain-containing protein [Oligoflexia bacterium]|nr:helix-turn-helix domain-containing protein [Oligoflexia bacterium]